MKSCAKRNSAIRQECGKNRKCALCPRKARFGVEANGNSLNPQEHLKVTVGPDPETVEKEVKLCCCNDRIHFSGDGVDVDLREGSALVEILANNILCAENCAQLPDASTTVGQLVVCKDTKQLFFSAECTVGEHIEVGSLEGKGLTCGHLIVGDANNKSTTLAPTTPGNMLFLNEENKPAYKGIPCGSLLRGDNNNNIEILVAGSENQFLNVQGGKPSWADFPLIDNGIHNPAPLTFTGDKVDSIIASRQIYQRINNVVHLTGVLSFNATTSKDNIDVTIPLPIEPDPWPATLEDALIVHVTSNAESTIDASFPAIGGGTTGNTEFNIFQTNLASKAGVVLITYTIAYRVNAP